jgi:uncharacterized protein YigE (DUF2233 family)
MSRSPLARLALLALAATLLGGAQSAGGRASPGQPACSQKRFEGSGFTVCAFDAQRDRLRLLLTLADGRPVRRLAALAAAPQIKALEVRFAMNAGMFDPAGAPLGLYVENGAAKHGVNLASGGGNFFLKPNGVFSVDADGGVHVETTDAFLARKAAPLWATQSGPMLVIKGSLHPSLSADGASRYVRNAVGRCGAHQALFVISDEPVSFGRLARLFRDELHCPDALYLDGAVSSLWAPQMGRMDNAHDLGPLVVVSRK